MWTLFFVSEQCYQKCLHSKRNCVTHFNLFCLSVRHAQLCISMKIQDTAINVRKKYVYNLYRKSEQVLRGIHLEVVQRFISPRSKKQRQVVQNIVIVILYGMLCVRRLCPLTRLATEHNNSKEIRLTYTSTILIKAFLRWLFILRMFFFLGYWLFLSVDIEKFWVSRPGKLCFDVKILFKFCFFGIRYYIFTTYKRLDLGIISILLDCVK